MLRKFIKDISIYAPSQFLPALTAFITTPILTRLFPPDEYGYYSLASSTASFLLALAVSGIGSSVIRFFPLNKVRGTLDVFIATVSVFTGALISIITVFSFLILFFFKAFIPPALIQFFPIIILIFVAQSITSVFMAAERAQEHSGSFTTFQLLTYYGSLGLGLLLVIVGGLRIEGLLWGAFIANIVLLPFLIFLATKGIGIHPLLFQFTDAVQIWEYGWPLALGNVAMWGLRVSDLFIISSFRSERDVGLYSVSYNISSKTIDLLVSLFLLAVGPLIIRTWETEGLEATEKALTMITRVYLILCLPASVGLTILASPFVALLTTPDYYEGAKIVGFVVFSSFAWGLSFIASMGITTVKRKTHSLAANQIIAASVHIGLQMFLVPRFGYIAAAISTLIGYTVLLILQTLSSRPYLTWRFPFITLRNVIIASAFMGLVAWGINGLSGAGNNGSPIFLFLGIIVAIPVYFAGIWLLGEANADEKKKLLQYWHTLMKNEAKSNL